MGVTSDNWMSRTDEQPAHICGYQGLQRLTYDLTSKTTPDYVNVKAKV